MSQTDKGVLIFAEWFEAMSKLCPTDYKALMNAVYRYQILGEKPPEFKGKSSLVAAIIFPYVERRLESAKWGKRGSSVRYRAYGINPIIDEILDDRANRDANKDADG